MLLFTKHSQSLAPACVYICGRVSLSLHSTVPLFIWTSWTTSIMQKVIIRERTLHHDRPLCADGCSNEVRKPSWQARMSPMQIKHSGTFTGPQSWIFLLLLFTAFFIFFNLFFKSLSNQNNCLIDNGVTGQSWCVLQIGLLLFSTGWNRQVPVFCFLCRGRQREMLK